jgi:hypothetical protein
MLKDGNKRWVGCEFVFLNSKCWWRRGAEGHGLHFFTFFIFTFVNFWGLLLIKEGGKWGMALFWLKNNFLLLIFLIVCKFLVISFHFQRRKGGHGFRVNKYNLYLLDWSQALILLCTHYKGTKKITNNNSPKLIKYQAHHVFINLIRCLF